MKIPNSAEVRAQELRYAQAHGLNETDLVQMAADAAVRWIAGHAPSGASFCVLAGCGNNGSDGLAIAAGLRKIGFPIRVVHIRYSGRLSEACRHFLNELQQADLPVVTLENDAAYPGYPGSEILIDAILGTGLNRAPDAWLGGLFRDINHSGNRVIAIDIPSGMSADKPASGADLIHASDTLCMQYPKRALLHSEQGRHAGRMHVLDLGFGEGLQSESPYHLQDEATARALYRPANEFAHKGSLGTLGCFCGSKPMMGAAMLCASAALHAGCGKVVAHLPESAFPLMQLAVPEVVCAGRKARHAPKLQAAVTGCGIGTGAKALKLLHRVLDLQRVPQVFDADALNLLAEHPPLLTSIPEGSILTPHPKEYDKLFGLHTDSMDRLESARQQAATFSVCIVMKGRYTACVHPDGSVWYNTSGNPGMATAGSGDVLSGIIGSLLAQGYKPAAAMQLGVWLHGCAGDLAAAVESRESVSAGTIIRYLGKAYSRLAPGLPWEAAAAAGPHSPAGS